MKRGENSNFTLEKTGIFHLNQVIKVRITCCCQVPQCDEAFHVDGALPQNPPRQSNQETNNRGTQLEREPAKYLIVTLENCPDYQNEGKTETLQVSES